MRRAASVEFLVRLAALPVPLYIALIAVLHIALPTRLAAALVFDPPVVMLELNTLFIFGVSIRILPHPFFETADLRVEFEASSVERFRELAAALDNAAQSQALEGLFQLE